MTQGQLFLARGSRGVESGHLSLTHASWGTGSPLLSCLWGRFTCFTNNRVSCGVLPRWEAKSTFRCSAVLGMGSALLLSWPQNQFTCVPSHRVSSSLLPRWGMCLWQGARPSILSTGAGIQWGAGPALRGPVKSCKPCSAQYGSNNPCANTGNGHEFSILMLVLNGSKRVNRTERGISKTYTELNRMS